jgi:hypothetical protein
LILRHKNVALLGHASLGNLVGRVASIGGCRDAGQAPTTVGDARHVGLLHFPVADSAIHFELLLEDWVATGALSVRAKINPMLCTTAKRQRRQNYDCPYTHDSPRHR